MLKRLIEVLSQADMPIHIMLPSGDFVPSHFHITEVGKVTKSFIDCGGTVRDDVSCVLQVWTANDTDHRLLSGKLEKILRLAEKVVGDDDLPVRVEYGHDVLSVYTVSSILMTPKGPLIELNGKQTECLAPDKCGVTGCC